MRKMLWFFFFFFFFFFFLSFFLSFGRTKKYLSIFFFFFSTLTHHRFSIEKPILRKTRGQQRLENLQMQNLKIGFASVLDDE